MTFNAIFTVVDLLVEETNPYLMAVNFIFFALFPPYVPVLGDWIAIGTGTPSALLWSEVKPSTCFATVVWMEKKWKIDVLLPVAMLARYALFQGLVDLAQYGRGAMQPYCGFPDNDFVLDQDINPWPTMAVYIASLGVSLVVT